MALEIKHLGHVDYQSCWQRMQAFTLARTDASVDQLWIVEHPPVFTQGLNGQAQHLLRPSAIPVVNSDRGGQITYHGPGQVVIYVLIDIKRRRLNVRQLVSVLEQAMLQTLAQYGVSAYVKADAPGVYVAEQKIGSVGLRIKRGCSYHGLSLNNDMDLTPFNDINPCGYQGLQMTQLADLGAHIDRLELTVPLVHALMQLLGEPLS